MNVCSEPQRPLRARGEKPALQERGEGEGRERRVKREGGGGLQSRSDEGSHRLVLKGGREGLRWIEG